MPWIQRLCPHPLLSLYGSDVSKNSGMELEGDAEFVVAELVEVEAGEAGSAA